LTCWWAIEAANAIEGADAIVVPTIVLCELVWVLKRAYRYASPEIIGILRRLVAIRAVEIERPAAEAGIVMLARGGDFADGVIRREADYANRSPGHIRPRASPDWSVPTKPRFWGLGPPADRSFDDRASARRGPERNYKSHVAPRDRLREVPRMGSGAGHNYGPSMVFE
jgi:PIN domain